MNDYILLTKDDMSHQGVRRYTVDPTMTPEITDFGFSNNGTILTADIVLFASKGYMEIIKDRGNLAYSNMNKLDKLLKELDEYQNIHNEPQYKILPIQREFLIKLQTHQTQNKFTSMEQLCIAHCIKSDHYSDMHKDTLNKLIKNYSKKVK